MNSKSDAELRHRKISARIHHEKLMSCFPLEQSRTSGINRTDIQGIPTVLMVWARAIVEVKTM
jgi:hypothetical protein